MDRLFRPALGRQWRVFLLTALLPLTSWSQQKAVTLEVAPKDLAIAAGEQRTVLVIASVSGSPVRKLKLRAHSENGTHVKIGSIAKLPDEVRGDVSWPVSLTKDADGKTTSRIVFEALYETGDVKAPVPGIADGALDLTVKARPKNEEVATASIQANFDRLEERRNQDIYLLVSNLTDVPVQITGARLRLPGFAGVMVGQTCTIAPDGVNGVDPTLGPKTPLSIQPRLNHTFAVTLCIPDSTPVLAGKYLMSFNVDLTYHKDGYSPNASIVENKEFQAGVLGDQEFAGVTSAPFLLLSGFLFVTVLGLLLSKVWPRWSFELDYKKPEFYLVGTLLSMLNIFFLYPWLGPILYRWIWHVNVKGSKLLTGYSLEDIINIWVLSLSLAVLPWMLIGGSVGLFFRLRAAKKKEQTPTVSDLPLAVLFRLKLAHQSFQLTQATLGELRLWELPLPTPDPARKWLAARIVVTFPNQQSVQRLAADDQAIVTQAQSDFRGCINRRDKTAQSLWELLNRIQAVVRITWEGDRRPQLADRKEAPTVTGPSEDFVSEG